MSGVWFAPGRANLLGEHTDYNGGLCLPIALEQGTTMRASTRPDDRIVLRSNGSDFAPVEATLDTAASELDWAAYVVGVLWQARRDGLPVGGLEATIESNLPVGAGLSSSAALSCVTAQTCADLFGWGLTPHEVATLARRCENEFVGAPTGIMDQIASSCGTADHALEIDTATEGVTQIPFALRSAGLRLLVIDSRTPHKNVSGEYAARRRSCEEAAKVLGSEHLAQVPVERVDELEPLLAKRARHIITDSARVAQACELLRGGGDPRALGPLFNASHASMRDDFEITAPSVDLIQRTAVSAGAHGARMTGGGFGGCVIAIVDEQSVDAVFEACLAASEQAGFPTPSVLVAEASDGARRLS